MKNKFSAVVCYFLIICTLFIGATPVSAENDTVGEIKSLIDGIVTYKVNAAAAGSVQKWLDGELTDETGVTSEWYVIALRQYTAGLDFSGYADALEAFLSQNETASATSRQRYSLALIACGRANNAFVASTADDSIGEQGVMSWVYGLHLLNNGVKSNKCTAEEVVETLLTLRLADGGWSLTGEHSDIDVTAMTVQALAAYYDSNSDVRSAVDTALDFLGSKQLDDGGYQSFGTKNPESCAQVLVALSSVGIEPTGDARFIKNGKTLLDGLLKYQLTDGSFRHTEDGEASHSATVQAFYSLVSLWRMRSGLGPLYVLTGVPETDTPETLPEITETTAETENIVTEAAVIESSKAEVRAGVSYKVWICLSVLAVMLIACLILWICKKRHFKNFIFVFIIGAVAVCTVLVTNFNTADGYYSAVSDKTDVIGKVTLTIRCDTIAGKSDSEYIPSDGEILPFTEFDIADGDSVFDILVEAARKFNIQMENEGSATDAHGMVYISGINYLYELEFGDLSGWVYHVNGVAPSVGCGDYTLSDGDVIEWLYTLDLGNDVK